MDWSEIIQAILSLLLIGFLLILIGFLLISLRYVLNWLFNLELGTKKLAPKLYFFSLIVTIFALYHSIFNNPNSYEPVVDDVAWKLVVTLIFLCLLPSIQPLLPSIKSFKILDFVEFNRELKKVDSELEKINNTLSTLIALQNVSVGQRADQRTEFTVNIGAQVDDIRKLIDNLKPKYGVSESDIPAYSRIEGESKSTSLLRLRFGIEEKLRHMARYTQISPSQDVLEIVQRLQNQSIIDFVLAESLERIIRVTKEVTDTGIELRTDLADEIIKSGNLILAALRRVEEKIQQRYQRQENPNFQS